MEQAALLVTDGCRHPINFLSFFSSVLKAILVKSYRLVALFTLFFRKGNGDVFKLGE